MVETEAMGGQEWDGIVSAALDCSGVNGTAMLGGSKQRVSIPFGLQALVSALLHFVAPEEPRRLRVYTYDITDIGCLLEVRGARDLSALPETLIEVARHLGVNLHHTRLAGSSSVLLTLPSPSVRS